MLTKEMCGIMVTSVFPDCPTLSLLWKNAHAEQLFRPGSLTVLNFDQFLYSYVDSVALYVGLRSHASTGSASAQARGA